MKGPSKSTGVGGSLSGHSGREGRRWVAGRSVDQLRPDVPHRENAAPAIQGDTAYCVSCHAIYHPKHWHLDEAEYQRLAQNPEVQGLTCPSCRAIERGDFHGELHLKLEGLERFHDQILNTLYKEESRARSTNPHERIGRLVDQGAEIEVDTVSPFLAHRLGGLLKKTFHGTDVSSDYTPSQKHAEEQYARVYWGKEEVLQK